MRNAECGTRSGTARRFRTPHSTLRIFVPQDDAPGRPGLQRLGLVEPPVPQPDHFLERRLAVSAVRHPPNERLRNAMIPGLPELPEGEAVVAGLLDRPDIGSIHAMVA